MRREDEAREESAILFYQADWLLAFDCHSAVVRFIRSRFLVS